MSKDFKHTIYNPTDCLSEKMLFEYIDNKLNQKERHIVEKHLLDCEMCADALEGLEMVTDRNRIPLIKEAINKLILFLDSARNDKKGAVVVSFNYKMAFSVAATIALLVVGAFFFNQINLKEAAMSGDMAELKETESPPPPPASPQENIENVVTETSASTGEEAAEIKDEAEKLGPSKILDQEIAMAEEEQKPGFYKNKEGAAENRNQGFVAPVESSGKEIVAIDATVSPNNDRQNNQLEIVSVPKTSAPEREKDAKLDDTKKTEEKTITGASGGTYAWSTPDQKQKNTVDNNAKSGEQIELAKKSDKGENSRSEGKLFEEKGKSKKAQVVTKETRADAKDEDGNFGGVVGYEPQSVSQDKAKAADEDTDQLKSQVLTNTSTTTANNTTFATTVSDSIEQIYSVVEQMPEYPGGNDSMMKFIRTNFNFRQTVDKSNSTTATKIYVQFIVGKDGIVRDPKIIKGINPALDKEAIRVVKMMPKWKPGKQNGKTVSTTYNLPIQLEFK